MTEETLKISELGAYTNNSMNREGLKKLVAKVNSGGGGTVDAYTKAETDALLADKADADDVYTKTEVDAELDDKQDVLTAGTNITIVDNVISATGGGSGGNWTLRANNNDWSDLFDVADGYITAKKDILVVLSNNVAKQSITYIGKGVIKYSSLPLNSFIATAALHCYFDCYPLIKTTDVISTSTTITLERKMVDVVVNDNTVTYSVTDSNTTITKNDVGIYVKE